MDSPLKRLERGQLRPKILSLYDKLFTPSENGSFSKDDSYWKEFFLLKCDTAAFTELLSSSLKPELSTKWSPATRELFSQCVKYLGSSDTLEVANALMNVTLLLQTLYEVKFVSYGDGIISALAGIENIEAIFQQFLKHLSKIIADSPYVGISVAAVRTTAVAAVCSNKTPLASFFGHQDMFRSIIQFIHKEDSAFYVGDALSLLGQLSSFNRDEGSGPYRQRLSDFVDSAGMNKMIDAATPVWNICIQDLKSSFAASAPVTTVSYITGALSWLSTGGASASSDHHTTSPEAVPNKTISLEIGLYEFVAVNKMFAKLFIQSKESFPQFLSLCTYLFQSQSKSKRAHYYTMLSVIVIRLLVENDTCGKILSDPKLLFAEFEVCTAKSPALPGYKSKGPIPAMNGVLDAIHCAIRYNTRKNLDFGLYNMALETLLQILLIIKDNVLRLDYHWNELWRTLSYLAKFMATKDVVIPPGSEELASKCVNLLITAIAICIVGGDELAATESDLDNLLYNLILNGTHIREVVSKFKVSNDASILTVAIIAHYQGLLEQKGYQNYSSGQVFGVLKEGRKHFSIGEVINDATDLPAVAGVQTLKIDKFREASEKNFFKRLSSYVSQDIHNLYASQTNAISN